MFDLTPFLQSSGIVQIHTYAAILALFLGGCVLWGKKGTFIHRNMGKVWVGLIVIVAVSSFWINGIRMFGPFSPIHLLSIYTLVSIFLAIKYAKQGRIQAHKETMKGTYFLGLVGAGFFTLVPGRILFQVIFGA
jgi:uncharacterized membrane protein